MSDVRIMIDLDDSRIRAGFDRLERTASSSMQRIGETAAGVFGGQLLTQMFNSLTAATRDFMNGAISEAAAAEASMNKLNNAMKMAGTFSQEASKQMQDLADRIQRSTTIEDDAVISMLAFARNITRSNEEAMKLTETAIDLGAALGTGPDMALQQLNQTLDGQLGRLARSLPELKKYTEAQLRAGAAVDYIAARFGGAAAGELNTYSGALTNLTNVWGNLQETIGNLVTSSRSIRVVFNTAAEAISEASSRLAQAFGGQDVFKDLLVNFSVVLQAGAETARRIGLSFELAFLRAKQAYMALGVLATAGLSDGLAAGLQRVNEQIEETKNAFSEESSVTTWFDELMGRLQSTDSEMKKLVAPGGGIPAVAQAVLELGSGPINSLAQAMTNMEIGFRMSAQNIALDARKAFQDQGAAAFRTLVGGISTGMAAIGRALVKGEDLFQAFGGAMLGAIGQALMAEGAARILQGIARSFSSYGLDPTAQGLITTGSAMSVAGGAMAALGSGVGGGSSFSTSGGGGGGATSFSSTGEVDPAQSVAAEKGQMVTVQIQGDVLDSRESGLRIVELINEAFGSQGAKVIAAV